MGCFSGNTKGQSVQQVEKLTPAQQELLNMLSQSAMGAIPGVGGATIPGMEFAPGGPSPLQQQAFGLAGQLPGQIQEQFAFDPSQITQAMAPVGEYAQNMFQEQTIPAIMGALGGQGTARSSGAYDVLGREGRNLSLGLASQFAPMQYQGLQDALSRQYGGAMQMPGMLGQLGGVQQGFPEAQRQFELERFMMGRPEVDPRLGFIGPAFTSAYDTAVQQGFMSPGLGSQLLAAGGQAAGAYFGAK